MTGYEMEKSGDNESACAKTMTESARKEGEVVCACDARRGTLYVGRKAKEMKVRRTRNNRGRPKRRWLDRVRGDIEEKRVLWEEMYDRYIH